MSSFCSESDANLALLFALARRC